MSLYLPVGHHAFHPDKAVPLAAAAHMMYAVYTELSISIIYSCVWRMGCSIVVALDYFLSML